MEALLMYVLKMLICSGLLFGYYRLALYNERFHQWNRFYLLMAMLLSVVVPFISIPIFTDEEPANIAVILTSMPWNAALANRQPQFSGEEVLLISMVLISVLLFLRVVINITRLFIAYKTNPVSNLNNRVELILTQLKHAPFSFFNWLFWRQDIDPASENGQRMLSHELTHIREHHSADKIFTEVLLCIFWMNPFFWLIRRELGIIHEFLADSKAIGQQDGSAFAAMILQALHVQPAATNGLVNPFFSSQIKRRLQMITTSKEPRYSYLRRLSGLVLMICSAITLTISIEQVQAQKAEKKTDQKSNPVHLKDSAVVTPEKLNKAGNVVTIEADSVVWNENKREMTAITSAGERVKIELKQGNIGKAGELLTIVSNSIVCNGNECEATAITSKGERVKIEFRRGNNGKINIDDNGSITINRPPAASNNSTSIKDTEKVALNEKNQPLYILDGKEISQQEMEAKNTNTISSIDILKGENATSIYGEKGKNGVVVILSKGDVIEVPKVSHTEVKINGTNPNTLIIADGVEISEEEMKKINPDNIESVSVVKRVSGIEKYGNKGKDGVIEITTKQVRTHDKLFTRVEHPAEFPGGQNAFKKYLDKNLSYPDAAQKAGTEGIARIQFVVDENGWISNVKILNDPGNGIGEEAMQLIKKGPRWQPAVQNGRNVVNQVELSIPFKVPAY